MSAKQAPIHGLTLMLQFRELLAKRMEERNISISELAREAEVGRPYLHRVLSGKQTPTVDWMEKVGRKVGINVKLTLN